MISALAGLLLQAAAPVPAPPAPPPPPASARQTPKVRAKANLASLFTDQDYPAEASRLNQSGTTGFRLEVGTDGLVKGCSVTESSGSDSLDRTTCRLLTERAHFSPARDRRGGLVADSIEGRITWQFNPSSLPRLEPSSLIYALRATPAGEVSCTILVNARPKPEGDCPAELRSQVVDAARAWERTQELTEVTLVAPEGQPEPIEAEHRGTRYFTLDVTLSIAPDGSVLECQVVRDEGRVPAAGAVLGDGCATYGRGAKLFRPLPGGTDGHPRAVAVKLRGYADPPPAQSVPMASPPPRPGEPARARANLASLFSDDDYPSEAVREREQGTVGFRLEVGADGQVADCTITSSSGHATLDSTTCRLLTERARFTPARDPQGRPTTDSVVGRITWRLPEEELTPFKPSLTVETMTVNPAGEAVCTTATDGQPAKPASCDSDEIIAAFAREGGTIVEATMVTAITPEGESELADHGNHGRPIVEAESVLSIAPDGSVLECRVARKRIAADFEPGDGEMDLCEDYAVGARLFEPAPGVAPGATRKVRVGFRLYFRILSRSELPIT